MGERNVTIFLENDLKICRKKSFTFAGLRRVILTLKIKPKKILLNTETVLCTKALVGLFRIGDKGETKVAGREI